jgi:hypothetical protein
VKRLFGVALGILTAIGGFMDIGDIVANTETGARVALVNLGASFFITFLTLAAEIGGVALAIELATSVNYLLWVPIVAFLVWLVVWRVKFDVMENVFGLASPWSWPRWPCGGWARTGAGCCTAPPTRPFPRGGHDPLRGVLLLLRGGGGGLEPGPT